MKYQPPYFGTVSLVSYLFFSTTNLTSILKSVKPQTFPFHCNLPLGTPSSPAFVLMSMLTVLSRDWFFNLMDLFITSFKLGSITSNRSGIWARATPPPPRTHWGGAQTGGNIASWYHVFQAILSFAIHWSNVKIFLFDRIILRFPRK